MRWGLAAAMLCTLCGASVQPSGTPPAADGVPGRGSQRAKSLPPGDEFNRLRGGGDVAIGTPMCPMRRALSYGELTTNSYQDVVFKLWEAARKGDERKALQAVKQGAWSNHISTDKPLQMGALHLAALGGHSNLIQGLVTRGADINLANRQGLTPLHCAAQRGHLTSVQTLIRLGADITRKDRLGDTAWDKADMAGFEDIAALLQYVTEGERQSFRNVKYAFEHQVHPTESPSKLM